MRLGERSEAGRPSWVNFLVALGKRIDRHDLTGLSAQVSYYFCLALFPFLILIAAVVGLLPFTHLWDNALPRILQYFPQDIQGVLWNTIDSLVRAHKQFLSAGLVGTLWAATNGLMSLMSALNTVYEVPETRTYLRRLGVAVFMLFVLIFLLVATVGLLNAGRLVDRQFVPAVRASVLLRVVIAVGRWALTMMVALACINLVDHVLPNFRRQWRWLAPGTLIVAAGWLLGPLGFNIYILRFASYHKTYGVLGAFVILMVWFYISSLIALIGAEINSLLHEYEEGRSIPRVPVVTSADIVAGGGTLPGHVAEGQ